MLDSEEWKFHRKIYGLRSKVESKLFHIGTDGTTEMFLNANEVVSVPFIFQSFNGGSVFDSETTNDNIQNYRGGFVEASVSPRHVEVCIRWLYFFFKV